MDYISLSGLDEYALLKVCNTATASYYRKMHYTRNWPKDQLTIKTVRTANGYQIEAAIGIPIL